MLHGWVCVVSIMDRFFPPPDFGFFPSLWWRLILVSLVNKTFVPEPLRLISVPFCIFSLFFWFLLLMWGLHLCISAREVVFKWWIVTVSPLLCGSLDKRYGLECSWPLFCVDGGWRGHSWWREIELNRQFYYVTTTYYNILQLSKLSWVKYLHYHINTMH